MTCTTCHDPSVWGHTECSRSLWAGMDDLDTWERHARDTETRRVWRLEMTIKEEEFHWPAPKVAWPLRLIRVFRSRLV